MEIDESLLQRAPLSDYEKELVRLIDIQGLETTKVALKEGKDKSTISIQHKKALEKLQKFIRDIKHQEIPAELASNIFRAFEKHMPLTRIVIKYKVQPKIVKALYKEWITLKEEDLSSPNVPTRLKQLEDTLKNLGCFTDHMYERFECDRCRSKYYYAIRVHCTKCQKATWWGYHPKK